MACYDFQSIRKLGRLSITMIILVALVVQTYSKECESNHTTNKQNSFDKLVEKLADRRFKGWNLQLTHLDNTVLAKIHQGKSGIHSGILSTSLPIRPAKLSLPSASLQFSPPLRTPARSSLSTSAFVDNAHQSVHSSLNFQRGRRYLRTRTTRHSYTWRKAEPYAYKNGRVPKAQDVHVRPVTRAAWVKANQDWMEDTDDIGAMESMNEEAPEEAIEGELWNLLKHRERRWQSQGLFALLWAKRKTNQLCKSVLVTHWEWVTIFNYKKCFSPGENLLCVTFSGNAVAPLKKKSPCHPFVFSAVEVSECQRICCQHVITIFLKVLSPLLLRCWSVDWVPG